MFYCGRLIVWAVSSLLVVSSLVRCQDLPYTITAGCCLAGPGHETADCRTLGVPQATVGSLMCGFRVSVTLGLLPTSWQVKSGPRVCARHSCFLKSDCGTQGSLSSF